MAANTLTPEKSQAYQEKWQNFLGFVRSGVFPPEVYNDLLQVKTQQQWYGFLHKHQSYHFDPQSYPVPVATEANSSQKEPLEEDNYAGGDRGGGHNPHHPPEVIEEDHDYGKLANDEANNWLKKNNQKNFDTKEGMDFLYGSLDDPTKESLNDIATARFRGKYIEKTQYYEKLDEERKKEIKKKPEEDNAFVRAHERVKREYEARVKLLDKQAKQEQIRSTNEALKRRNEELLAKIEAKQWGKFATNYHDKAIAYAEREQTLAAALLLEHPQARTEPPTPNSSQTPLDISAQPSEQPSNETQEKKKGRLYRITDRFDQVKDKLSVKRILSERARNVLGKIQTFLKPQQFLSNYAAQAGEFLTRQGASIAQTGARISVQALRAGTQMALQVGRQAVMMATRIIANAAGSALTTVAGSVGWPVILIILGIILLLLLVVAVIIIIIIAGCAVGDVPIVGGLITGGKGCPKSTTSTTAESPIPGLTLELDGPFSVDNGKDIQYRVNVSYDGSLAVTISDPLPTNTTFVEASGVFDKALNSWSLNANTPISLPDQSIKKYLFTITLHPTQDDIRVINKVVATSSSPAFAGGLGCPSQQQIDDNKKDRNSCKFLSPSIDIFNTNISQEALNAFTIKYSQTFTRGGAGDAEEFRKRVNYIVTQSQKAGLNPAIFLGYWKTESAFSTVGSRDMGCAGDGFYQQVDCATGLSAGGFDGSRCATSRDVNSPGCKSVKSRIDGNPTIYDKAKREVPVATFDTFADLYGPLSINLTDNPSGNNNCIHTYNSLLEIATELSACSASSFAQTSTDHPVAPPADTDAVKLRQNILDKFGITMDGFDQTHLAWSWEKLWDVSNTNFPNLIKGVRIQASANLVSTTDTNCTGINLWPGTFKDSYQFVLTHELAHYINFCNQNSELDMMIAAYNQEGAVSYYAKNVVACVKYDGASSLYEDYADTVAYYLNPEQGDQGCIAIPKVTNPLTLDKFKLHANSVKRLLGVY